MEKLRVSNSGGREASPDSVLDGTPLPSGPEKAPLSSVLATQRSAQQDTCESVVGASGSPEQMSRLIGKRGAERDQERKVAEAKQPPSKGSALLGLSLDAQDMVELGSPNVSSSTHNQSLPPQQSDKLADPDSGEQLQRSSGGGGESADDGSGELESSSERDYRSSGAEGSLENDRRARRVAPPLGPPSGMLIARRKSHGVSGEGSPQGHIDRKDSSRAGEGSLTSPNLPDSETTEGVRGEPTAVSIANAGKEEAGLDMRAEQLGEADKEAAARREALRRQSRQERAKARLARRQANQAAEAAGRSPAKDVRQPLAESHLSHVAPGWDQEDAAAGWAGGSWEESGTALADGYRDGVLEREGRGADQRKGYQTEVHAVQAESDSDMSFGGWLPGTRAGR